MSLLILYVMYCIDLMLSACMSFVEEVINPNMGEKWASGERARTAIKLFGALQENPTYKLTDTEYCRCRNYVMMKMALGSSVRAGVLIGITHGILAKATVLDGMHIYTVS